MKSKRIKSGLECFKFQLCPQELVFVPIQLQDFELNAVELEMATKAPARHLQKSRRKTLNQLEGFATASKTIFAR